jgi:four helix bundle protein
MRDHRDLEVWQKAMDLAADVYVVTRDLPTEERFGLCGQMRRAAVSIASNIAEGAARRTTKDFIAFAHTARGSLAELETQVLLAARIGFPVDPETWTPKLRELGKLLNGLIRSLQAKVTSGTQLR